MTLESRPAPMIAVRCTCGRSLRAKAEQVGTEIKCWDCHKLVTVSMPRARQRVARELFDGINGVIQGQGLRLVLVASVILTTALCVPYVGIILAGLVLAFGANFYGEIIRRVSRVESDENPPRWWSFLRPRSFVRPVLCLLMSAGTVVPLWGLNLGYHQSPHWSRLGILIAGLSWIITPIAMLCAYLSNRQGRLGIKQAMLLMARHPIATLMALAVVPVTLVMLEIALGLVFFVQGNLTFFALDFFRMPSEFVVFQGVPHFNRIDFRSYPPLRFIDVYTDGLRHGYTFSAAIPASLSLSTRNGLHPSLIILIDPIYMMIRVLLVLVIVTCLLTGFAIQACWLGAIAAVEKKRPS